LSEPGELEERREDKNNPQSKMIVNARETPKWVRKFKSKADYQ